MKCLIIASDIGISAPGIVYETIVKELTKYMDVSLIALQYREGAKLPVSVLPHAERGFEHYKVERYFFSFFGRNLLDDFWLCRQKFQINSENIKQQDFIISFASFHHYKGILLGHYLSKKYNKKWVIYSVDAIPAPIGWVKNDRFYRNTRRFITNYISQCDAFFSSNQQMLDYQIGHIKDFKGKSGVLYTPIRTDNAIADLEYVQGNQPVFLYTGGIYGPRKVDALIEGFRLFLKEHSLAKLVFVGLNSNNAFEKYQNLINNKSVQVYGFSNNLLQYYQEASVMIDINAYFDNDVFLSSKIVNYLPLRKPIISITGLNSPSRNIFVDDPTIIHCKHDASDIYDAMSKAIQFSKNEDWEPRQKYINLFSVEHVIDDLLSFLNSSK